MLFWNSLAFSMIQQMLEIWSLVPLPFLNQAWTYGCSWFTYCWMLTWRILSITLLASEMSAIVQQFVQSLALPFFGIGMKSDLFLSCGHCWVFQTCFHIECSTFTASSLRIWHGALVTKSWPTLVTTWTEEPGRLHTVHGILKARILEWVAISFSRGSSQPRNWTQVSYIIGGFLTNWATREALVFDIANEFHHLY